MALAVSIGGLQGLQPRILCPSYFILPLTYKLSHTNDFLHAGTCSPSSTRSTE